jgi:hypothetical protein
MLVVPAAISAADNENLRPSNSDDSSVDRVCVCVYESSLKGEESRRKKESRVYVIEASAAVVERLTLCCDRSNITT